MSDRLMGMRIKSRFIIEIRCNPLLSFLDRRGDLINKIHSKIINEYPHWGVDNSGTSVLFFDNLEYPKDDAVINFKKFAYAFEDAEGIFALRNYFEKFIFPVYGYFREEFNIARRIGVRIISLLNKNNESFEQITDNVMKFFSDKIPKLGAKDCKFHVIFENGHYLVGPVKEGEMWFKENFKRGIGGDIKVGYGIDVDSYVKDVEIKYEKELEEAIRSVFDLSRGIEEQLATSLGLIDG